MKIKRITIQGFRGFNEKQTIDLHDQLTLLYAPNSYGKTSISEALEWLLYGITSKVEKALSTEEYKGSYRNLHLNESEPSFVNVVFLNKSGEEVTYMGELGPGDSLIKLVDGKQVMPGRLIMTSLKRHSHPATCSKVPSPGKTGRQV